jgi:spore germination protein YaaH
MRGSISGAARLLADTAARARAITSLVELCRRNGYWGIQFDVENITSRTAVLFTAWFTDAARALHAGGFTISAAIVHQTDALAGPTAYHRFLADSWRTSDVAALGRAADFLSVMSYDQHTRRTPPGPVAGMPWVRAVTEFFLLGVPRKSCRSASRCTGTTGRRAAIRVPSVPARARTP